MPPRKPPVSQDRPVEEYAVNNIPSLILVSDDFPTAYSTVIQAAERKGPNNCHVESAKMLKKFIRNFKESIYFKFQN